MNIVFLLRLLPQDEVGIAAFSIKLATVEMILRSKKALDIRIKFGIQFSILVSSLYSSVKTDTERKKEM